MAFEAYAVAVRVRLIDTVTVGLMNISRAFMRVHGDATKLQRQIDAIKFKRLAEAALTGTGLFGLSMIGKTIPAAKEYAHQLALMNAAGMKHVEIQRAITQAWAIQRSVPTSTATQNLAAIRELRMVFGDTGHAIDNLATVQRLQAILANVNNGHGGKLGGESAYTVAKALEMRGATRTPAEFNVESDMMVKAIIASGGKVTPQDFLSNIIYGRRAAYGWNNAFTYTILPTLIQEMKSSGSGGARGPGNALMSAYAAVVGGTIPQKSLEVWSKLGLLDPSKVVWTKTHSMKGVKPGGVAGAEIFQANPYQWAQEVLLPALTAHGVTSPAQMRQQLQYLFPNRTASIMDQMVMQAWKFQRDQRLIRGAGGLGEYQALLKTDPYMAQQALAAQWRNLLAVIGYQILPMVVSGTLHLVSGLRSLADAMRAHPTLTKALVVGFAALSAAMAFGGMVLLLSAAFSAVGLVVPVVTAGAAALAGAIAAISWPITLVIGAVAGLGVAIYEIVKHWDASKGIIANIKAEWGMFVNFIWDKMKWLLSQVPGVHIDGAGKPPPVGRGLGVATVPGLSGLHGAAIGRDLGGLVWDHSPFIAHPKAQKQSFTGDVHLDGQKVGQVVWRHQADAMDRAAPAVGSAFDTRMGLAPVGLSAA